MPLLNYTTTIAASKTVSEVQGILAKAGATTINLRYDQGRPVAIMFSAPTTFGDREFILPVNADKVLAVLKSEGVKPSLSTVAQAERVAWRILKDWIEAQMAIIAAELVTLDQVMLPYMVIDDGRATVFEAYQQQQLQIEGSKR